MPAVAAFGPPVRRRGGRRILIALVLIALIAGLGIVYLNMAATAAVNATGILTVYQDSASLARGSNGSFEAAKTGAVVQAGDSLKTDVKGRAAITLPDGTI